MSLVHSSITIPFTGADSSNTGGGGLSLVPWSYPVEGVLDVTIKMSPDVDAELFTTIGDVVRVATITDTVLPEFRTMQNSDSIFSGTSDVEILLAFDEKGREIYPTKVYDSQNRVMKFSPAFYGLVRIGSYTEQAAILAYTPVAEVLNVGWGQNGSLVKYGTVAAFHKGQVAVYHVPPYSLSDIGNDEFEVYRKTSQVLVTSEGTWEMPETGMPDAPDYTSPTQTPGRPDTSSGYLITQRVHEIGMADVQGRLWIKRHTTTLYPPMLGSVSYTPIITTTITTLPNTLPSDTRLKILDALAKNDIVAGVE